MAYTRRPTGNEDTDFFRCKRCGFPCNLSRDKTGPGSGLTYSSIIEGSGTITVPVVQQGCPFCGTKNYKDWQR